MLAALIVVVVAYIAVMSYTYFVTNAPEQSQAAFDWISSQIGYNQCPFVDNVLDSITEKYVFMDLLKLSSNALLKFLHLPVIACRKLLLVKLQLLVPSQMLSPHGNSRERWVCRNH